MAFQIVLPRLGEDNFEIWKFRVEMELIRQDLTNFISEVKPEAPNAKWIAGDAKARAVISSTVEDSQVVYILNKTTAKEIWDTLCSVHESSGLPSVLCVLRKLCTLRLGEGGNLPAHLSEMVKLHTRLQMVGEGLKDRVFMAMILSSLPPSYGNLIVALENRPEAELTSEFAMNKLREEYRRRTESEVGSAVPEDKALHTKSPKQYSSVCYYCRKPGHFRKDCFLLKKRKGGPKSVANFSSVKCENGWVIDSGASRHMCGDPDLVKDVVKHQEGDVVSITLADGKTIKSTGVGHGVICGVNDNGIKCEFEVKDILYVPNLRSNLLSVSRLCAAGYEVMFTKDLCNISKNGRVVLQGILNGNIYVQNNESAYIVRTGYHSDHCWHLWHERFGHRNDSAIKSLFQNKLVIGATVRSCPANDTCETCLEGKLSRLKFPKVSERKSKNILDLVHSDVCGPMPVKTPSGNRYFVTLIDDYSRYTTVSLIKTKAEVPDKIIDFVNLMRNQFGRIPKILRSDGGGEYCNDKLKAFYRNRGILMQTSTPYTPQQNGVAERKNRYLEEMVTSMLLGAKLDTKYWGEAVLCANYLQNRLPSSAVNSTPYEMWFGRKPQVDHLRVFGCSAWVHIPKTKREKFASKARKLTFIGYAEQQKGYRLVDLANDRITISRDVKFLEKDMKNKQPISTSECVKPSVAVDFREVAENDNSDECVVSNGDDRSIRSDGSDNSLFLDTTTGLTEHVEDDNNEEEEASSPVRRNRGKRPAYLDEYVVGVAKVIDDEPTSWRAAMESSNASSWKAAMDEELKSHEKNGTWDLVEQPNGKNVIGSRWVFKKKRNEKGEIIRFKARLVAQGFSQIYGTDYDETFAPVTRYNTVRTLLAIAGRDRLFAKHLDVATAYLHGNIDEEIYMRQPPGYEIIGQEEKVCRIRRSIYGLKQSARCWNKALCSAVEKLGFITSKADACLFTRTVKNRITYLVVYVDDLLIVCKDENEITNVHKQLKRHFDINMLGDVKNFLGLQILRDSNGIFSIGAQIHIEGLITTLGLHNAKVAKTPMDQGFLRDEKPSATFKDGTQYRSIVGSLMYIANCARPDIAACVGILGRKFSSPTEKDYIAAKRVVRYLKGTKNWYLHLGGKTNQKLEAYSDSDWAGDVNSRKSTTGFMISYAGGVISWTSRRQNCVSLSSMEAEYCALTEACQEIVWQRRLLEDMTENTSEPTTIMEDNQSCIFFAGSGKTTRRSKHIETKQNYVRDLIERKIVSLKFCPTENMTADIFTKPLGTVKHYKFCKDLNLS